MKILNIYGQEYWHTDARIIGNRNGLLALQKVIAEALHNGKAMSENTPDPLFASDGEGYSVIVECHDDEWGIPGGVDSFWNKHESRPEYTRLKSSEDSDG